jgi:hypothetical protein
MFILRNTKQCILGFHCFDEKNQTVQYFGFSPGNHEITKADFDLLKKHDRFVALVDDATLVFVGHNPLKTEHLLTPSIGVALKKDPEVPADAEPSALVFMSAKDAEKIVDLTYDIAQLQEWYDKESRKGLKAYIKKQMDKMSIMTFEVESQDDALKIIPHLSKEAIELSLEKEGRAEVVSALQQRLLDL